MLIHITGGIGVFLLGMVIPVGFGLIFAGIDLLPQAANQSVENNAVIALATSHNCFNLISITAVPPFPAPLFSLQDN